MAAAAKQRHLGEKLLEDKKFLAPITLDKQRYGTTWSEDELQKPEWMTAPLNPASYDQHEKNERMLSYGFFALLVLSCYMIHLFVNAVF